MKEYRTHLQIIVNSHINRFHSTYKKYFDRKETNHLVRFFFDRVYTLEGKEERDALAEKMYDRFRKLLSEKTRSKIEPLIELNRLTDELDLQMARVLKANHPHYKSTHVISPAELQKLYHQANAPEDRIYQLELLLQNLELFFDLSKHPMADIVIKPARVAAAMVGAGKVYKNFLEGYQATKPVSRELFFEFTSFVAEKEKAFLSEVYNRGIEIRYIPRGSGR